MGASLDPTLLHMPSEGTPLSPEQTFQAFQAPAWSCPLPPPPTVSFG